MILDASVILKWFLDETESNIALGLKESHVTGTFTIVAPDILIYEVGNALRYEPEFSPDEVNCCLEELYELNIDIIAPISDIVNLITEIAYQKDITFYDASYIALAQSLNLQYITADEKLYNKVKAFSFVTLLKLMQL